MIECKGPTNGRTYTVAVYFKGQRLAAAQGHNIQQAEMNAATKALENSKGNSLSSSICPKSLLRRTSNYYLKIIISIFFLA